MQPCCTYACADCQSYSLPHRVTPSASMYLVAHLRPREKRQPTYKRPGVLPVCAALYVCVCFVLQGRGQKRKRAVGDDGEEQEESDEDGDEDE